MKGVMYHYVRPGPGSLNQYRYLHVADFENQLDSLAASYGMTPRTAFEESLETGVPASGCLLTFDDGFADHYDHVLPALLKRGAWGIFYIPTGTYLRNKLLDVHRIHVLLGHFGGTKGVEMLLDIVTEDMLRDQNVDAFRNDTYAHQDNDAQILHFKRMLNYYISYEAREPVLDRMMAAYLDGDSESSLFSRFYLSLDQLREMADRGMVIGSHGVDHLVMSKLTVDEQRQEIKSSCDFLAEVLDGPVDTFCYPYGGDHTFTSETERLLEENGIRYSFSVDPRDVTAQDLKTRRQGLPRFDCNDFPHGKASIGPRDQGHAAIGATANAPVQETE
jgi:peptidoglycan/xylan/chitin deacetylase (PgdA/CDA1 family)